MANENYQVIEGGSITIPCPIYGVPPPHTVWFKEGQVFNGQHSSNWEESVKLESDIPESHIKFMKAQRSDSGRYICLATNKGGDAEVVIDLEVLGITLIPHM